MKLVLDAFWWVAGPPSLRHVLRETVFTWSALYPDDELTLVVRREHLAAAWRDVPAGVRLVDTPLWPQALAATIAVPAVAKAVGADVVFTHNFAATASHALSVTYLHDVLFATNPEWFTATERAYFSLMLRWVHRADVVFTSTESEAKRIRAHSHARVVLPVGLGLSEELIADGQAEHRDASLKPRRFVLTVGRLNTRKNLGAVIAACLATGRISPARPLVVVGSRDGRNDHFTAAALNAIETGAVRFTGFVDEARLRWYYRNTSLFVCLSRDEGFGMPPIEAAYFGAPLVVSDVPVFRETLGGRARFVDPTDIDAAAAAIVQGIAAGEAPWLRANSPTSLAAQHNWVTSVRAMREAAADRMGLVQV